MKPIPLQLITVKLDNGEQGIFVGTPLIEESQFIQDTQAQVSEIWFSDVRDLPEQLPLSELIDLVKAQLCQCQDKLH